MAFERKSVTLRGDAPGWTTEFTWYAVGPADAPEKVHLQAALHADEHPGTMLLHHLLPMLQAMNDPRIRRIAILAEEKHCAIEGAEAPAQAPVADPCGPGVVTPAMVTGGVVPPAPASTAASGRTDPFKTTTPAVAPPPAADTSDPFVKQGSKAPAPAENQPTTDPFKKK